MGPSHQLQAPRWQQLEYCNYHHRRKSQSSFSGHCERSPSANELLKSAHSPWWAPIFPCETLYCGGKKTRDAAADSGTKTISVVADATRAAPVDTNLTTCRKFISNAYS